MKKITTILILSAVLLAACALQTGNKKQKAIPQTSGIVQQATLQATVSSQPEMTPFAQATIAKNKKEKSPNLAPTPASQDFIAYPLAGRPTDSSVTLNMVPAASMEFHYEYGTASENYTAETRTQSAEGGLPVETLIDGLQANTRYYYRLLYGANRTSPEQTFTTQRSPGSSFTFDIQGDSHPERIGKQFDPQLYTRTLLSAAKDRPDFYMTIGDDFSVDALKSVDAAVVHSLYINQRQWLGLVAAPLFLVNGNHEQAALANINNSPDNVAVWAQTARNSLFPQPAPDAFYSGDSEPVDFIGPLRDYYAFTWGDALFVVIDPYWHSPQTVDNQFGADRDQKGKKDAWNATLGDTQYQWLKTTLESSQSPYKFVFAHHVNGTGRGGIELAHTGEWGDTANLSIQRPGWDKTIHQLMVDNGVTIFFQGHDHLFARQELDGVIYQTLPEPANPNYTLENAQAYQSGDRLPNSGHLRVMISASGVQVDYVRSYLDKADELAFTYLTK